MRTRERAGAFEPSASGWDQRFEAAFLASVVNIIANWCGDRMLSAEAVRAGKRRYLVALCLLLTAAGLLIPIAQSLTAVVAIGSHVAGSILPEDV